jgi:hypothetical protein
MTAERAVKRRSSVATGRISEQRCLPKLAKRPWLDAMRQERRHFLFALAPSKGISKGAEKILPELPGDNAKEQGASPAPGNPDF